MKVYTNNLGIVCVEPETGYLLKKAGFVYKKVFLSKNDRPELYTEVIDKDYIFNDQTNTEIKPTDNLTKIKEELIDLSKSNLHDYLESNPLFSTVKYPEGKYYNITITKQSLLADNINTYKMAQEIGADYPLYWNDTGEVSEPWTLQEAMGLLIEIKNYVAPIIYMQQCMEKEIKEAATLEELDNIDIRFTDEAIGLYSITYNNKMI